MRSDSKEGLTTFKEEENVIKTEPLSIPDAKQRQREAAPNHLENTRRTERSVADNTEAGIRQAPMQRRIQSSQRSRDSSAPAVISEAELQVLRNACGNRQNYTATQP